MRAFLAAAEEGSLSAAARALKTTQPTLSRQVSALEDALGVTLFERGTRGLVLTEAGGELQGHVRAMGDAASRISLTASRQSQEIAGEVSVTASDLLSAKVLPEIVRELHVAAPGLQIRIVAANDIRDLTQREADIAIRHIRPEQHDLIAQHIGDFRASLYAATEYLEAKGRPTHPRDLQDHAFIGVADTDRLIDIFGERGIQLAQQNFIAASNSGVVAWELLQTGVGMSIIPELLGEPVEGIEKVLPSFKPIEFPIWIATHRELHTSRRIRVVFDTLVRRFREYGSV